MNELDYIQKIKTKGWKILRKIPENEITYEMCSAAIEMSGNALVAVPPRLISYELCYRACVDVGMMIERVPRELLTPDLCEMVVLKDADLLSSIPEAFQSRKIFLLCAQAKPEVIKNVPIQFCDIDFCLQVIDQRGLSVVEYIPAKVKTGDFYNAVAQVYPEIIWEVPKKHLTEELCISVIQKMGYNEVVSAIKSNPALLGRMHPSLYNHECCKIFVESPFFWNLITHVDTKYLTQSGELSLTYDNRNYLFFMKHILVWEDICFPFLKLEPHAIQFVNKNIINQKMCFGCVENDPRTLDKIPLRFRTKELCMEAIAAYPYVIGSVPKEFLSEETIIDLMPGKDHSVCYVPFVKDNFEKV